MGLRRALGLRKPKPISKPEIPRSLPSGLRVHIACSDFGWVLETLAREIEKRLDYVTVSRVADPKAPIQYYLTYNAFKKRVSPIECAWFTHIEERDEQKVKKFFDVAHSVDFSICHAKRYADALGKNGVPNTHVVPPGVDSEFFTPRLKIGIAGRTYETGRKGEALLEAVKDLPGVEWHFSGEGWNGRRDRLPQADMADFYRAMDYILVPSFYEGGPMCVPEALACGIPVIAPDIGWVSDFPHIEYPVGNAEALRNVLQDLLAKKQELRKSIEHLTWDAFAAAHGQLFEKYYAEKFPKGLSSQRADRFERIYVDKKWGGELALGKEVFSGEGSLPEFSKSFIDAVRRFCVANGVRRIVDLGCGDFQVGRLLVADTDLEYCGVDISPTVVDVNTRNFASDKVKFQCLDIVEDALPEGDLVIVRQVLQHLSNGTVSKILDRIRDYSHAIVCDEIRTGVRTPNEDIEDGGSNRVKYNSSLLLEAPPFKTKFDVLVTAPSPRRGNILRTVRIL